MNLPVEKFDPFRQVSTRSGLGSWPVCFAGGRWFGLPDFRLCGRACTQEGKGSIRCNDHAHFGILSLLLPSVFLCCPSVGGCGVFFWQGKRCLSEASCFSQKKNTPHPAYPPPQPTGQEPKPDPKQSFTLT